MFCQIPVLQAIINAKITLHDLLNLRSLDRKHRNAINTKTLSFLVSGLKIVNISILRTFLNRHYLSLLEYQIVKGMLKNPNIDLYTNFSVFMYACKKAHLEVVRLLLKDPRVDPAIWDNAPISWACESGCLEVVRLLLQHPRVDPTGNNNLAIQRASEGNYTDIILFLLKDSRIDPSVENNRLVKIASAWDNLELLRLLLQDPRIDATAIDNFVIQDACYEGKLEVVRILLEHGVDPTTRGNLAIQWASKNGHVEIVHLLLGDPRVDPSNLDTHLKS